MSLIPGTTLSLPDGTRFTLRQNDEELVEVEILLPPHGLSPPPHVHPEQEEEWEVLDGSPSVRVGDVWRTLAPGDSVVLAAGTVHTIRNRSNQPVRVLDRHRPASGFADYLEALARAGRAGDLRSPAGVLRLAVVAHEHRRMQRPASRVLLLAITVAAAVGRPLVGTPASWPPARAEVER